MTPMIEILIQPDGKTSVQTKGFLGPSCREASRLVEDALGQRSSEILTPEFHQGQDVQHVVRPQR